MYQVIELRLNEVVRKYFSTAEKANEFLRSQSYDGKIYDARFQYEEIDGIIDHLEKPFDTMWPSHVAIKNEPKDESLFAMLDDDYKDYTVIEVGVITIN